MLVLLPKSLLQMGHFSILSLHDLQTMWPASQQGTGVSLGIVKHIGHSRLASILVRRLSSSIEVKILLLPFIIEKHFVIVNLSVQASNLQLNVLHFHDPESKYIYCCGQIKN